MKCSKKLSKAIALSLMVSQAVGTYPVRAENQEVPITVQNVQSQGENDVSEGTKSDVAHDNAEDTATDETQDFEQTETTEGQQENGMDTEENELENPSETEEVEEDSTTTDDTTKPDVDGTNTDKNDTVTNETQEPEKTETTEEQKEEELVKQEVDATKKQQKKVVKAVLTEQKLAEEAMWEIEVQEDCYYIKSQKVPSNKIEIPTIIENKKVKINPDIILLTDPSKDCEIIIRKTNGNKLLCDEPKKLISNIVKTFNNNSSSYSLDLSGLDLSNLNIGIMEFIFNGCKATNIDLSGWDVNEIINKVNTKYLFRGCEVTTLNLSDWDFSNVSNVNISDMFSSATITNLNLSNWDTKKLSDVDYILRGCTVTNLNLSGWYYSDVIKALAQREGWNSLNLSRCQLEGKDVKECIQSILRKWPKVKHFDFSEWDTSNVTSMKEMFAPYYLGVDLEIESLNLSGWDTRNVADMSSMFAECENLQSIEGLSEWNTRNVMDVSFMFAGCENLQSIEGLSNWDTSQVTSMGSMFYECKNLQSIEGLSEWNTRNVTDMSYMFYGCRNLQSIEALYNWHVDNVYDLDCMFWGCDSLTDVDLSKWNTKNLKCMYALFLGCSSLTKVNLSSWDTSQVTDMSWMFNECISLNELNLSGWDMVGMDLSGIKSWLGELAKNCPKLENLNFAKWNISHITSTQSMFTSFSALSLKKLDLSGWDTSKVTDMSLMFSGCANLQNMDLSGWDTSQVTDMSLMFDGCANLQNMDLSGWDTSKVTNMGGMFRECENLQSIEGISSWDTSKVTDMSAMFMRSEFLDLDLSSWNVQEVIDMTYMFAECKAENLNLSGWNVKKLQKADRMFGYLNSQDSCELGNVNLSKWHGGNEIDMKLMFGGCKAKKIDLSDWSNFKHLNLHMIFGTPGDDNVVEADTIRLSGWKDCEDIDLMFGFTFSKIKKLDLTNWENCNITSTYCLFNCAIIDDIDMSGWKNCDMVIGYRMFGAITNLKKLKLPNVIEPKLDNGLELFLVCKDLEEIEGLEKWDTSTVTDMSLMFQGCSSLKMLDLSNWNTSKVRNVSGMFYKCNNLEVMDLFGWDLSNAGRLSLPSPKLRIVDLTLKDSSTVKKEDIYSMLSCSPRRNKPLLMISNQASILNYDHSDNLKKEYWAPCEMNFTVSADTPFSDNSTQKTFETYSLKDRTKKTLEEVIQKMKEEATKALSKEDQERLIGWELQKTDQETLFVPKSTSFLSIPKMLKEGWNTKDDKLPLETLYQALQGTYVAKFKGKEPILEVEDKLVIEGETFDREVALKDVTATTNDKKTDLISKVQVDVDKVDTSKPGEYKLEYTITDDDGNSTNKIITVTVWGKPNIQAENKTITQGEVFDKEKALENVTAQSYDKVDLTNTIDVDLSKVDTSKPGKYEVTYTVKDDKGATKEKTIILEVLPTKEEDTSGGNGSVTPEPTPDPIEEEVEEVVKKKPTIQAEDKTIGLNEEFKPLEGVTATDGEEKDITDKIVVTKNEVDTKKPGKYEVTYEVSDKDGETVSKTITVEVKKPQKEKDKEKDKQKNKEKEDWKNPILEADDKEVVVGKSIDLLEDIVAKDWKGNDIRDSVEIIDSNVDFSKPGSYEVTYEVTDSKGYKTKHTIQVVVREPGVISVVKKKQGKAKTKNTVHTIRKKGAQKQTRRANQVSKGMKQSIYEEEGKKVLQLPKTLDKLPITYLYSGLLGSFLGIVYFLRKRRE